MTLPLDIQKLASDALASVEEDERTKTASDQNTAPQLNTEIGQQLKQAAELIRDLDLESVSFADLEELRKQAGLIGGTLGGVGGALAGGMVGGPMGMLAGGALGAGLGNKAGDIVGGGVGGAMTGAGKAISPETQMPQPGPMNTPKMGSDLGNELRALATQVRTAGHTAEETRLLKAAHMYNAGVALAHLIGEAR